MEVRQLEREIVWGWERARERKGYTEKGYKD